MLEKSVSALRVVEKLQIKDVGSLLDMDNFVDYTFEIHLIKLKLFVHSICPQSLYLYLHVVKRGRTGLSDFDRDNYR